MAWHLHGYIPWSGPPSWNRCFPINFLLRFDDFRAWHLHGYIPWSGHPFCNLCFPINFLLRIDDFRAWRLHSSHIPWSGYPFWYRCFPFKFLSRSDDFGAWRLHGYIPGSGHPSGIAVFLYQCAPECEFIICRNDRNSKCSGCEI